MTSSPSERTVWIVRHGLRIDFADPQWVSSSENPYNPPLHPKGLKQAEETAERLKSETIDHVFASPFLRTVQTGSAIAAKARRQLNVEAGFSEWLTSREFEHMPLLGDVSDLHKEFPSVNPDYKSTVTPDFPEDREALDARTGTALTRIFNNHFGNLLIVSHGSPIQAIHKALTGTYPDTMQPMCSVTRFDLRSGTWTLVTDADSSHLTTPDETHRTFYSRPVPEEQGAGDPASRRTRRRGRLVVIGPTPNWWTRS